MHEGKLNTEACNLKPPLRTPTPLKDSVESRIRLDNSPSPGELREGRLRNTEKPQRSTETD